MKTFGAAIPLAMATVWAVLALNAWHAPGWTWALPVVVSGLLAVSPRRGRARLRTPEEARRVGRLVAVASAVEGVAILVGVNLAAWAGQPDLWVCVLALVVGLHFLPLARWLPAPSLYVTAAGLILASGIGLALDGAERVAAVAGLAALVIWGTCASFVRARFERSACAAV